MTLRIGCNAVLIMQVSKTIPKEIGFAYHAHELIVEGTPVALSRDGGFLARPELKPRLPQ